MGEKGEHSVQDVKVMVAENGLHIFLTKVVSVTGAVKGKNTIRSGEKDTKKGKEVRR